MMFNMVRDAARRRQATTKTIMTIFTSSNFLVISENALKMAVVEPDTVTMRSGHDPSDMLMMAPDCHEKHERQISII